MRGGAALVRGVIKERGALRGGAALVRGVIKERGVMRGGAALVRGVIKERGVHISRTSEGGQFTCSTAVLLHRHSSHSAPA